MPVRIVISTTNQSKQETSQLVYEKLKWIVQRLPMHEVLLVKFTDNIPLEHPQIYYYDASTSEFSETLQRLKALPQFLKERMFRQPVLVHYQVESVGKISNEFIRSFETIMQTLLQIPCPQVFLSVVKPSPSTPIPYQSLFSNFHIDVLGV